jgi:nitroreductase
MHGNTMTRRNFIIGGSAALLASTGVGAMIFNNIRSRDDYSARMDELRRPLSAEPSLLELVRFATLAANGHNTQPWRFRLFQERIEIRPDLSRRTPVVDPDDHHLYASLGCAVENLALAATAQGRPAEIVFDPSGDGALLARLQRGASVASAMFAAIPHRQSTRSLYDHSPLKAAELDALTKAAALAGVSVAVITDRRHINRIRELVVAANTIQMTDASFVRELKQWIRFNPTQAMRHGDGLYSAAGGNPTLPDWLGQTLFGLVFRTKPENDKYAKQIDSSAALAVISADLDERTSWVLAGRACQRLCLEATVLGLKTAFINQPGEVPELRGELAELAGFRGRRPNFLLRIGRAGDLPMSPRRPVADVVDT